MSASHNTLNALFLTALLCLAGVAQAATLQSVRMHEAQRIQNFDKLCFLNILRSEGSLADIINKKNNNHTCIDSIST